LHRQQPEKDKQNVEFSPPGNISADAHVQSPTSFLSCLHSVEYLEGLTKCQNLYESLFQEMHHLVKQRCFEVLSGLDNNKQAYHESVGRSSMF